MKKGRYLLVIFCLVLASFIIILSLNLVRADCSFKPSSWNSNLGYFWQWDVVGSGIMNNQKVIFFQDNTFTGNLTYFVMGPDGMPVSWNPDKFPITNDFKFKAIGNMSTISGNRAVLFLQRKEDYGMNTGYWILNSNNYPFNWTALNNPSYNYNWVIKLLWTNKYHNLTQVFFQEPKLSDHQVAFWVMNSDGYPAVWNSSIGKLWQWDMVTSGDMDKDGNDEIFLQDTISNKLAYFKLNSEGWPVQWNTSLPDVTMPWKLRAIWSNATSTRLYFQAKEYNNMVAYWIINATGSCSIFSALDKAYLADSGYSEVSSVVSTETFYYAVHGTLLNETGNILYISVYNSSNNNLVGSSTITSSEMSSNGYYYGGSALNPGSYYFTANLSSSIYEKGSITSSVFTISSPATPQPRQKPCNLTNYSVTSVENINAYWNSPTKGNFTQNYVGSSWTPLDFQAKYNTTYGTCNFNCTLGYSWNAQEKRCKQNPTKCMDYKTQASCVIRDSSHSMAAANTITDGLTYCSSTVFLNGDTCKVSCYCSWDASTGNCTNANVEYLFLPDPFGLPSPSRLCGDGYCNFTFSQDNGGCGNGLDSIVLKQTAIWTSTGTGTPELSCVNGTRTFACPSSYQLDFTTNLGIILVVVIIVLIYLLISYKKNYISKEISKDIKKLKK